MDVEDWYQRPKIYKRVFKIKSNKKIRSIDDNDRLTTLFRCVEENLSEWEKEFMISILSHDNVLTDRQKAIVQKIKLKSLPFIFGDV